jgi:hypothetical protein
LDIQNQLNPVYTITFHFFVINFNISLLYLPRSHTWTLSLMFSNWNFISVQCLHVSCTSTFLCWWS